MADLKNKSLDELFDWIANVTPGSPNDQAARAEIRRREMAAAADLADKQYKTASKAAWAAWASAFATAFAALATCIQLFK